MNSPPVPLLSWLLSRVCKRVAALIGRAQAMAIAAGITTLALSLPATAADFTFFEQRIRPVLVNQGAKNLSESSDWTRCSDRPIAVPLQPTTHATGPRIVAGMPFAKCVMSNRPGVARTAKDGQGRRPGKCCESRRAFAFGVGLGRWLARAGNRCWLYPESPGDVMSNVGPRWFNVNYSAQLELTGDPAMSSDHAPPTDDATLPNEDSLIRLLCRVLRHRPEEFGLALDAQGWTPWRPLWEAIRPCRWSWVTLDSSHVLAALAIRHVARFEVSAGRIRARYGHSAAGVQVAESASPPEHLFHGTGAICLPLILEQGLKPMGRSQVHLTESVAYAWSVAQSALGVAVVIRVAARRAQSAGLVFQRSGQHVWLTDRVPPAYLSQYCVTPVLDNNA